MKKLKFKLDGLKETLTREQMKKISGGYYPYGDSCDERPCPDSDGGYWECYNRFIETFCPTFLFVYICSTSQPDIDCTFIPSN